jgi:hypothetical protein
VGAAHDDATTAAATRATAVFVGRDGRDHLAVVNMDPPLLPKQAIENFSIAIEGT